MRTQTEWKSEFSRTGTIAMQLLSLLTLMALAGCASAPKQSAPAPDAVPASVPPELSEIRIGHPMDGNRPAFGYYVLIRKNGDSWIIDRAESAGLFVRLMDPTARTAQAGEVLYVPKT